MSDDIKVYEYKRGDLFKVNLMVKNAEVFTFRDLVVPNDTSEDVIAEFIDMAEKAVIGSLNTEEV